MLVIVAVALALSINIAISKREQAECAVWSATENVQTAPWAKWQIAECNHYGIILESN